MADNDVADITPAHDPIAVARDMVERAPGCRAGVCVLVKADGNIWYDCAGRRSADVLWALNCMIHQIMTAGDGAGD
jgi:hypothetical protein